MEVVTSAHAQEKPHFLELSVKVDILGGHTDLPKNAYATCVRICMHQPSKRSIQITLMLECEARLCKSGDLHRTRKLTLMKEDPQALGLVPKALTG